jgi:phosphoribosylanthranilate isomerase
MAVGVDYIGLNFIPSSKRCISLETGQSILASLPKGSVQFVALFQDQPLEMVKDYAEQLGVDLVQLHGSESPDYVRDLDFTVMKAIAVDPRLAVENVLATMQSYPDAYFVLDRYRQGEGDKVKLELAKRAVTQFPDRVFLAGGLTPDNLENVITAVRPYGIDIASGVRSGERLDMSMVADCLRLLRK